MEFLNSWRALAAWLVCYAVLLFSTVSKLSLWLDEIIDLRQIRDFNLPDLVSGIPINAGGVPLSYLVRAASVHLLGYSPFSGRLPSLLFALLAGIGLFLLGRQTRLRFPLIAVLFLCLMPLQLRYALESRPYSQALAISIWGTVAFRAQLDRPGVVFSTLYGLLAVLGLYTQPYTFFVFLSHAVWLVSAPSIPQRRRLLIATVLPLLLAAITFLPWHLWVMSVWSHAAQHQPYPMGIESLRVLLHELVGAGYIGTVLTIALSAAALLTAFRDNIGGKLFWILYLLVPVVLALIADRYFGYFFAIRQVITIGPPLAILAALGGEWLLTRYRIIGNVCLVLLLLTFSIGGWNLFRKPHEDFHAASLIARKYLGRDSCMAYVPASSADLYAFFVPELRTGGCPPSGRLPPAVVLAEISYDSRNPSSQSRLLTSAGYRPVKMLTLGEPRLTLYRQAPAR